jgi:putative ATPase
MMKAMGYSGGYRYPHNFSGNYVPEEYLPDALRGERFYEPGENGEEAQIRERLDRWRRETEERRRAEEAESAAVSAAARTLDK